MSDIQELLETAANKDGKVTARIATMWVPLEGLWMHDSRWHKVNWPIRWCYLLCAAALADDQEAIDALQEFAVGPRKKADRDIMRKLENRLFDKWGKCIMLEFSTLRAKMGNQIATTFKSEDGVVVELTEGE